MKNKICLITLLVVTLMFAISCKEDDVVNPNGHLSFFSIGDGNSGDGYDLMSEFDKPNVIGLVSFITYYRDEYMFEIGGTGAYTPYTGTDFYADAEFSNSQKTDYASLSPAAIIVNAIQMQEYAMGQYYIPDHLGIETYFGGGYNKIVIDSNQYFNKVVDSINFANAVHITNVSVGQVINRDQNFVINFTGATNNSLVEWIFSREKFFEQEIDTISSRNGGICNMLWNTGQVTITPEMLECLQNGWYSLSIIAYEPKYITLSSGKEICILGLSRHIVSIKIED